MLSESQKENYRKRFSTQSMVRDAIKNIDWVIEDLIAKGDQWIFAGAPKSGKSAFILDLSIALTEGKPYLNFNIKEKKKVLIIDLEMSEILSAKRVLASYNGDKEAMTANNHLYKTNDFKILDVLNPVENSSLIEITNFIDSIEPDLIVWDVLSRMHDTDENSNIKMSRVMERVRELSKGKAHIIVHHAKKMTQGISSFDSIRGASSILGAVDGSITIQTSRKPNATHKIEFLARGVPEPDSLWLKKNGLKFELCQSEPAALNNNDRIELCVTWIQTNMVIGQEIPGVEIFNALGAALNLSSTKQVRNYVKTLATSGYLNYRKIGTSNIFTRTR